MGDDTQRDLAAVIAALKVVREQGAGSAKSADPMDAAVGKLPGRGEWAKAAPAVAMACGTLLIVTFVIVFAVLAITGTPTDSFFRLINLFLNALGAMATLATLSVAMMHARRTLVNRAEAQRAAAHAATAASRAAEEAHNAAEQATVTAGEVNGKLTRRVVEALGPIITSAVDDAVQRAMNQRCPDGDDDATATGDAT